jgi:peptidoglycan/LPS O-acetylase OafA/YrhL
VVVVSTPRDRPLVAQAATRRLGNRPGLTGLRAVAIAIVIARHAGEVSAPAITAFAFGFAGVDIFFVLSGFLITSLLVGEHARTGGISLPQFYFRRALRLLPALFAFLLILLALLPFFQPAQSRRPLAQSAALSALFLGNIAKTVGWTFQLPHLWSLGMEEQFYLVWPLTLVVLLTLRASRRTIFAFAVGGAIAAMIARVALAATGSTSSFVLFYSPLHSDGLLIGCALGLAYAWRWLPAPESVRHLLLPAVALAMGVFLVVSVRGAPYNTLGTTIGLFVIALTAGVFVYAAADERPVWPLRFLTWRPVTYLGEISYALYIWHFPVLYLWPTNRFAVPVRILISLILAAASYHLIEKPFLRRKRRHTPDGAEGDAALVPVIASPARAPAEARDG